MFTNPIFFLLVSIPAVFFPDKYLKDIRYLGVISIIFLLFYDLYEAIVLSLILVICIRLSFYSIKYVITLCIMILFFEKLAIYLNLFEKINGLSFALITFIILSIKKYKYKDIFSLSVFFPHVLAGPIIHDVFFSKLKRNQKLVIATYLYSIGCIILVFSFQLLNQLDVFMNGYQVYVSSWFYLMGLFGNFFGYSLIALAYGYLMGIELPLNFNAPGLAKGPADFWRRWHISLSKFFSVYVFNIFRNNLKKILSKDLPILAIFLTLFASGIWHGIGIGYFIWVLFHFSAFVLIGKFNFKSLYGGVLFLLITTPSWYFFSNGDKSLTQIIDNLLLLSGKFTPMDLGVRFIISLAIITVIYFIPIKYLTFNFFDYQSEKIVIIKSKLNKLWLCGLSLFLYFITCMLWVLGELNNEHFIYAGF